MSLYSLNCNQQDDRIRFDVDHGINFAGAHFLIIDNTKLVAISPPKKNNNKNKNKEVKKPGKSLILRPIGRSLIFSIVS